MADYDSEVVFRARIETEDVRKDLNGIRNEFDASRQILSNLQKQYNDFVNGLIKTPEQLGLEKALRREETQLNKNILSLSKLEDVYNLLKNSKGALQDEKSIENFKRLEGQVNTLKEAIKSSSKNVEVLNDRLSRVKLQPDIQNSVLRLRNQIDKLKNSISTQQVMPNFSAMFNSDTLLRGISNSFNLITTPLKAAGSLLGRFISQILSIGRTVFILHGIRSGFRGISETITNVISADNQFIVSLNQIKSNLLAAFYPIYQYVLPSLHSLMSVLATASSYLAQFISHIFGQNYKVMQEGARSFTTVSESVEGNTKSVNRNKNSFAELGKKIKKTSKELASFDKLNVLNLDKKTPKEPKQKSKSSGFMFSPTTAISPAYNEFLKNFDKFNDKLREKMKPTIDSFRELGQTIKEKMGGFALQAIKDFGTEFLDPASDYLFKIAIPKINNITKTMIENTNWENLNSALSNLWRSLEPFGETIGNGLITFYDSAIRPLVEWAVGNLIPAEINVLAASLDALNPIAQEGGAYLKFLWDKFFKPIGEWSGGVVVDVLNGIAEGLKRIGVWLNENRWFIETGSAIITGFAVSLGLVNTALWVQNGGLINAISLLITKVVAFSSALLANPLTWWVVGITAVISALILLIKHWDKVKEVTTNTINAIWNSIKGLWDQLTGFVRWLSENIIRTFGGAFGYNANNRSIGGMRLPGFAQGAVLKGGDPILAYLNDQPKGQTNIETPLKTMVDAFNNALDNNRTINNNNIVVEANGDIDSIISMLNFRIKQQDKLTGGNYISDNIFA